MHFRIEKFFSNGVYWFGRSLCVVFSVLYAPLTVCGKNHIPSRGNFIIAANHVSYLDPPLVGIACPRPANFLARETLFSNPVFGWFLRHGKAISLKRRMVDFSALKEVLRRLEKGEGLILFPEGARQVNGRIGRGFSGVGFLARKSKACVIPAYVAGSDKVLPKSSKKIKRGPVSVIFGFPVKFPQDSDISDEAFTQKIMDLISALKGSAAAQGL